MILKKQKRTKKFQYFLWNKKYSTKMSYKYLSNQLFVCSLSNYSHVKKSIDKQKNIKTFLWTSKMVYRLKTLPDELSALQCNIINICVLVQYRTKQSMTQTRMLLVFLFIYITILNTYIQYFFLWFTGIFYILVLFVIFHVSIHNKLYRYSNAIAIHWLCMILLSISLSCVYTNV